MTDRPLPKLLKWPFWAADFVLFLLAFWIMAKTPQPFVPWPMFFLVIAVTAGCALALWPYILEYQTAQKVAESSSLTTAVTEIGKLQSVADQIRLATSQWQTAQEHSSKTVTAAKQISERMTLEANAFAEFMQKANDSEKGHLRLETEKLRRNEGEWIQVVVRLLDHVFALHQAGVRSSQPNVREQLALFQNACREVVRRIGLTPIEVATGDAFDELRHQLVDPQAQPAANAVIAETLATGYTFQGQQIRRALVRLQGEPGDPAASKSLDDQPVDARLPSTPTTRPVPSPGPKSRSTPPEPSATEPSPPASSAPEASKDDPTWPAGDEFRLESEPPKPRSM